MKYHFVRNKIADKIFKFAAIDTDENTADVFTKPLEKKKFQKLKIQLGIKAGVLNIDSIKSHRMLE